MTNSALSNRLLSRFQTNVADIFRARRPHGVALALSGGVDSMALAWLWHKSQEASEMRGAFGPFRDLPFHAIIVNHKLRPESDKEANDTSDRFYDLTGQKPLIVDVDWESEGGIPKRSKHETSARHSRYRALGTACRDLNVDAILTGHHADDNAESLLLRIIANSRTIGLQGMANHAAIPECGDLYGVSERLPAGTTAVPARPFSFLGRLERSIHVARPLLDFDKADLISLCQENGIPWAEDATNKDVTLTARNAARYAMASGGLPRAFQKPSLLALGASRTKAAKVERSLADKMHEESRKRLDLRSGTLSVVMPESMRCPTSHWRVKCSYVRDLLFAVTPNPSVSLSECEQFLKPLMGIDKEIRQLELQSELHSISGLKKTSIYSRRSPNSAAGVRASVTAVRNSEGKNTVEWRLTRQALSIGQLNKHDILLTEEGDDFKTPHFPDPTLWDRRFWILAFYKRYAGEDGESRGENSSSTMKPTKGLSALASGHRGQKLVIRALKAEDIAILRHDAKHCMNTEAGLKAASAIGKYKDISKPWDMVMPLPVIVSQETEVGQEVSETLIAIPSLGYIRPEHMECLQVYIAHKWTGFADKEMSYFSE